MQYNAVSDHKNYFALTSCGRWEKGWISIQALWLQRAPERKADRQDFDSPILSVSTETLWRFTIVRVVVEMPKEWLWLRCLINGGRFGSYLETLYTRRWRLGTKFVRGWMLHQPEIRQSNTEGGFTCTRATDVKKEKRDTWRLFQ